MTDIFSGSRCTFYKSIVEHLDPQRKLLATHGKNVNLIDLLTNERYTNQKLLNDLRLSGYGSEFYKENKKRLSAACFSSAQDDLTVNRSDENHVCHSGFIAFDIDSKDNPELNNGIHDMKDYLIDKVPYIAYLGASVSNIGLWGLFPISYRDEHYAHYAAMKDYFKAIGITIDNTQDISRLRFVCYDPDAHFELQPDIFDETKFDIEDAKQIQEYESTYIGEEIYIAACRWVEVKNGLKFQPGMIHNYLLRLYATLRSCNIPRHKILNWIYNNLIEESKVTTNCLDEVNFKKK